MPAEPGAEGYEQLIEAINAANPKWMILERLGQIMKDRPRCECDCFFPSGKYPGFCVCWHDRDAHRDGLQCYDLID